MSDNLGPMVESKSNIFKSTDLEKVKNTWKELGYSIRMLRNTVLVRTDLLPEASKDGIVLPAKFSNFYGELPHIQLITATVLSSGPKANLKIGDKICFQRLFFARLTTMKDKSLVGWINDERNVVGRLTGELNYAPMRANTKPAPKAPPGLSGSSNSRGTTFG